MKHLIEKHDHSLWFFILYLVVGLIMAMLINLSVLILFVIAHFFLDYAKYRVTKHTHVLSLEKALQDQLMDIMFIVISLAFGVYLSHTTPGLIGLTSLKTVAQIEIFSMANILPRFALIEHGIKGFIHSLEHVRKHTKHITIPRFGDWQIFYVQMILYTVILILLAPAVTAMTYADVWHNIMHEISFAPLFG